MVGVFDFFLFRLSFAVCAVDWTTLSQKPMLRWRISNSRTTGIGQVLRKNFSVPSRLIRTILHHTFTRFLFCIPRKGDDAVVEAKRALEFDPLSPRVNSTMASFYDYARRYVEAVVQHQKALELDPNFWIAYSSLGLSYLQKSLNKEAIAEAERTVALSPNNRLAVTRSDIGFNDFKHGFLAGLTHRAAGGGGPEGQHMIANTDTPLLGGSARPPLD